MVFLDDIDNLFCGDNLHTWAVVNGNNWEFDKHDCTIKMTQDTRERGVAWVGTFDGVAPNLVCDGYSAFMLQVSLIINEGDGSGLWRSIYSSDEKSLSCKSNSASLIGARYD